MPDTNQELKDRVDILEEQVEHLLKYIADCPDQWDLKDLQYKYDILKKSIENSVKKE
tara:strand:- start:198 stop:368 length:171 start_codon:yes stop_codon:yes gene_type:complete